MSKHQTVRHIREEISKLNRQIDLKIIQGLSYGREARRHKFLLRQLRQLSSVRVPWFSRLVSFV